MVCCGKSYRIVRFIVFGIRFVYTKAVDHFYNKFIQYHTYVYLYCRLCVKHQHYIRTICKAYFSSFSFFFFVLHFHFCFFIYFFFYLLFFLIAFRPRRRSWKVTTIFFFFLFALDTMDADNAIPIFPFVFIVTFGQRVINCTE